MRADTDLSGTATRLIGQSAERAERVLSMVRLAFCALVALRFWQYSVLPLSLTLLSMAPLVAAVGFSVWILARSRRPVSEGLLRTSVAMDALVCFSVLVHNALWPSGAWIGMPSMPDTATVLIMIVAAGLRLSPSAAALGALLNTASFFALVALDRSPPGARFASGPHGVTMYSILLVSASALSILIAVRTRRLVTQASLDAARVEQAHRGISSLLAEHHQLRTLLSSATLTSDLLRQDVDPSSERLTRHARDLRGDLEEINALVGALSEQALIEVLDAGAPSAVQVAPVAAEVVKSLSASFSEVDIRLQPCPPDAAALFSGGRRGLHRVLWNVVSNACQGDGTRGSSHVTVSARPVDGFVHVVVEDDGPGFPKALLSASSESRRSTKRSGSGLGLTLSERLVEMSGGSLALANRAEGGARVSLTLPALT